MDEKFPFEHFLQDTSTADDIINKGLQESLNNLEKNTVKESSPVKSQVNNSSDSPLGQEIISLNTEVHNHLKESISSQKYNAYFNDNINLISINDKSICFVVITPFIKSIIETHYLDQLNEIIIAILGKQYNIEFVISQKNEQTKSSNQNNILNSINNEKKQLYAKSASFSLDLMTTKEDLESNVESQYIAHMTPITSGIIIDPSKTFDNFVIGPSNNMAFATAKAVGKNPGKKGKYPSLYIYSSSGLGKTHLLHAVANEIKEFHPHLIICLITARDFMQELVDSVQNNRLAAFQKKYSENIDVLMIDDIHELKNKKGTQNEFFHVFNELYHKGKQLIFTSDQSPKEIDGIEERIKTRLQWGLVIDIQKPDLETRLAILKRKAYELDIYVPNDVLNIIACSIRNNIRELEGSLIKLSAFSDVMKTEIDMALTKELLAITNQDDEDDGTKISLESIAKLTASHFKVPLADLRSKARYKEITNARHIAMYLSKKLVRVPLNEIGLFYGGRDHSSVIHAVNKITNNLKKDLGLSNDLISIETLINQ